MNVSVKLSVITWRTMRERAAPMARRSANSRSRSAIRLNRRLAKLAHASRSSRPTAPSRNSSGRRAALVGLEKHAGIAAVLVRVSLRERCGDAVHLRTRVLDGNAVAQPAHGAQHARSALARDRLHRV